MSSKTRPDIVAAAERRTVVLELRKAGLNYRDIAAAIIKRFGTDNLPRGYDERQAHQDVARELEKLGRRRSEAADAVLVLELLRLDTALAAIWNKVRQGDYPAIDRMLRIMERRDSYQGISAAARAEINYYQELARLVADGHFTPDQIKDTLVETFGDELAEELFRSIPLPAGGVGAEGRE